MRSRPLSASVAGALLCLGALSACSAPDARSAAPAEAVAAERDLHSYAVPAEARVTHVDLDLRADFAAKRLSGTASLDLKRSPDAKQVVLDTKGLTIQGVTDAQGEALPFSLGASDPILGEPLTVELKPGVERIVINYETSPEAGALQWLTPAQTAGKKHPYLFSQGEAILTRSWIPTQDSPGIRQTYSAKITVPAELKAVMSAEMLTPEGVKKGDERTFEFRMPQAIAPYLIALAVGDLEFRPLGPRTGVYAEPSVVDGAAHELADLEKMVGAAESLYGPYRWGRYDVLVLPPSFPFGGMENPRLTFATPTILAGDRSLVSLIAHELAHSWSGNLVTNATWSDFWLNEGFTTYFENRIMEAMYGPARAQMLEVLDRRDLAETITEVGGPASPETKLHIDLAGRDPDDGMTDIAYNKGAAFLRLLETTVGRERWDAYLKSYFDRHAFQPMTTAGFVADLRANLIGKDKELEKKLRIDEWVYGTGLPDNATQPQSDAFAKVQQQVKDFAAGTPAARLQTAGWTTQEWQHFLQQLPETLTPAQLGDLDGAFKLSQQGNSEILFAWLRVAVRNRYQPAVPSLEHFLTSQGRRKFLKPLYQDLMGQGEWGQALAKKIYAQARSTYHPVSVGTIDQIVK
jgi:aminopeptidase N